MLRALGSERGQRILGAVGFWGLIAVVLLYNFPYLRALQHANELPRVYLTMAVVEEGRFSIDTYVKIYGGTMDMSRSFCLGPRVDRALGRVPGARGRRERPGCVERTFSNKAPGMSLMAVPIYAALRWVWKVQGKVPDVRRIATSRAWKKRLAHVRSPGERRRLIKQEQDRRLRSVTYWLRLGTAALPAFLFMLLLCYWLRPYVPEVHPRRVAVAAYGLGTLVFTYSVQLMSHQLATSLMFSAFILIHLVGRQGARWWLLLPAAGLLGGLALAADYQLIFAALPLGLYALWVVRPWVRLGAALLGAVAPLALLLTYHHACFGSIFWTGYEFLVVAQDQALHHRGFLGITTPGWDAFRGSFLSQDNGLFYFSPWLLAALCGLPLLWAARGSRVDARPAQALRQWRERLPSAEWLFTVAVIGAYSYFISSVAFWRGGWQTGPRYICAMLPCFVLPYALLLRRVSTKPIWWALCVAPALTAVAIYAVTVATYPHFPDKLRFPLFELVIPLMEEGYVSYNAGRTLLGWGGRASLLPYFIALSLLLIYLAAGPVLMARWRPGAGRRAVAGVLAVALAIVLLGSYQETARRGRKQTWSKPVQKGARETYGHFVKRANRDIRRGWEPAPGRRARRARRRR